MYLNKFLTTLLLALSLGLLIHMHRVQYENQNIAEQELNPPSRLIDIKRDNQVLNPSINFLIN